MPRTLTYDDRSGGSLARANERVESNMGVAESIAWKFAAGGAEVDDLRQVAYVGLIKASRRYDPGRGVDFLSFAVPTITGELKRHVRDHGYFVRPPRRVQELRNCIARAREDLRHRLQREPACADLAHFLQVPPEEIQEALGVATRPAPLEAAHGHRSLPADDSTALERFELLTILAPALRRFPSRERHILYLRFFKELTQQQIARTVGVSQVHVSRLLAQVLTELRAALVEPAPAQPAHPRAARVARRETGDVKGGRA